MKLQKAVKIFLGIYTVALVGVVSISTLVVADNTNIDSARADEVASYPENQVPPGGSTGDWVVPSSDSVLSADQAPTAAAASTCDCSSPDGYEVFSCNVQCPALENLIVCSNGEEREFATGTLGHIGELRADGRPNPEVNEVRFETSFPVTSLQIWENSPDEYHARNSDHYNGERAKFYYFDDSQNSYVFYADLNRDRFQTVSGFPKSTQFRVTTNHGSSQFFDIWDLDGVVACLDKDFSLQVQKDVRKAREGNYVDSVALNNGENAQYRIQVTNNGNIGLTGVTLDDNKLDECDTNIGALAAGETQTVTCIARDIQAAVTNTVTADSNETDPVSDTAKVTLKAPSLKINKQVREQNVGTYVNNLNLKVGGTAQYRIQVTNDGNIPLTGVTIDDNLIDACDRLGANRIGALAVGQTKTATCLLQDIESFTINTATADSNETDPVSDDATVGITTDKCDCNAPENKLTPEGHTIYSCQDRDGSHIQCPLIAENSFCPDGQEKEFALGTLGHSGRLRPDGFPSPEVNEIRFEVSVPVTSLKIWENSPDTSHDPNSVRYEGEQAKFFYFNDSTGEYVFFADLNRDRFRVVSGFPASTKFKVEADHGTGPSSIQTIWDLDGVVACLDNNPSLDVEKTVRRLRVGDYVNDLTLEPGQHAQYRIKVTNNGNVPLTGVTLDDNKLDSCDSNIGNLAVGETETITCILRDVQNNVTNVATADSNETDPVDDDAKVTVDKRPSISVTKGVRELAVGNYVDDIELLPGKTAQYRIIVKNTGNVDLTNVTLDDNKLDACDENIGILAVGETRTVRCLLEDVQAGLINTATADSDETDPVNDKARIRVNPDPVLEIEKLVRKHRIGSFVDDITLEPGDTAQYRIRVTNSGNMTLTNVTLDDDTVDACDTNIGTLAKDETTTITCLFTISNSQGGFVNTATADSEETPPVDDDAKVRVNRDPQIRIVKEVRKEGVGDYVDKITLNEGENAQYRIKVFNTGNIRLTNVSVDDNKFDECDRADLGNLQKGESITYRCVVENVANDIVNTATANSDQAGPVQDTAEVVIEPADFKVEKDLRFPDDAPYGLGEIVEYKIEAENTSGTVFNVARFLDEYDPNFLEFVSLRGKENDSTFVDLEPFIQPAPIANGKLIIEDLTEVFGSNFRPGDTYLILAEFRAINVIEDTVNEARINADGLVRFDRVPTEIEDNRNLDITKSLRNPSENPFDVGEEVQFRVVVRNTGDYTFDEVLFRDVFDTDYLGYVRAKVRENTSTNWVNIDSLIDSNPDNGVVRIDDVTEIFGNDFAPREFYTFILTFNAERAVEDTINTAIARAEEITVRDTATADIVDPIAVLDIDKFLTNDDLDNNTFFVGEEIIFTIRIENKGETTFDVVRFVDTFNTMFLDVNINKAYITKNTGEAFANVASVADIDGGEIVLEDITEYGSLGNLAPTEFYDLVFYFDALISTQDEPNEETINFADVFADDLFDEDDEPVKIIEETKIEIVQCNQLCGENIICDTDNGLVCTNLGNESRCRLATNLSSETCEEDPGNPEVGVSKVARADDDGDKTFEVGDEATFDIQVTNTGDQSLDDIKFFDNYDAAFLNFNGGEAKRVDRNGSTVASVGNLNSILNINIDGYVEITNLASTSLGDLNVGESYVVTMKFIVKLPGETTNIATAKIPEDPEDKDDDKIRIVNLSTDL